MWQRSAELCRQAYHTVPYSPSDHLTLLRRQNASTLTAPQLAVHRALFGWRDGLARSEDESCAYVLPNHILLKLAQACRPHPHTHTRARAQTYTHTHTYTHPPTHTQGWP